MGKGIFREFYSCVYRVCGILLIVCLFLGPPQLWPSLERLEPSSPSGGSPHHPDSSPAPVSAFDVEIYRDILDGRDPLSK